MCIFTAETEAPPITTDETTGEWFWGFEFTKCLRGHSKDLCRSNENMCTRLIHTL